MIFALNDMPILNTVTNAYLRRQPRPIIPLSVAGPNGRLVAIQAIVDTGADEVLLPGKLLKHLGFTAGVGATGGTTGIGGRNPVVYHPVRLEIRIAPNDRVAWHATVGFTTLPHNIALFGVAGGLEFFHTTLNVIDSQLGLFPHPITPLAAACVTPHAALPVP